ncbi:anthrone oxygenase family protein [Pseudactinotalea terrae]|uniref:anthrone oxygenase family protein n=1 Tax=Pseudactinotalea terrae TaxID=1743262 RepID=UPI001391A1EA|nr:anthrone oxygenase family protein [Pseudactinotalea terrae]
MEHLVIATAVVAGLLAGLELAVSVVVGPILATLDQTSMLRGRTQGAGALGRAMPVAYGVALVLVVASLLVGWDDGARGPLTGAVVAYGAITALSLGYLVPMNTRATRWDPEQPPSDWQQVMRRWDRGHAVRVVLLVVAFALLVVAVAR